MFRQKKHKVVQFSQKFDFWHKRTSRINNETQYNLHITFNVPPFTSINYLPQSGSKCLNCIINVFLRHSVPFVNNCLFQGFNIGNTSSPVNLCLKNTPNGKVQWMVRWIGCHWSGISIHWSTQRKQKECTRLKALKITNSKQRTTTVWLKNLIIDLNGLL